MNYCTSPQDSIVVSSDNGAPITIDKRQLEELEKTKETSLSNLETTASLSLKVDDTTTKLQDWTPFFSRISTSTALIELAAPDGSMLRRRAVARPVNDSDNMVEAFNPELNLDEALKLTYNLDMTESKMENSDYIYYGFIFNITGKKNLDEVKRQLKENGNNLGNVKLKTGMIFTIIPDGLAYDKNTEKYYYYESGVGTLLREFIKTDCGYKDPDTDLEWFANANTGKGQKSWDQAKINAAAIYCGGQNWSLPSKSEFEDLITKWKNMAAKYNSPASWLSNEIGFTGVATDANYWSSTISHSEWAWTINLNDGGVGHDNQGAAEYVWPVRRHFTKTNCGYRDPDTGLEWFANANTGKGRKSWGQAIINAAAINCRGQNWRLPSKDEFEDLIAKWKKADKTKYNSPASWLSNEIGFTGVATDANYWSSTVPFNEWAWTINLNNGGVGHDNQGAAEYVWPVRLR